MAGIQSFDEQTVGQFAQKFEQLFYDGDSAGMAAYYTDDARLMGENIEPLQGRDNVAMFWRLTIERGKAMGMKRSIVVDEVRAAETLSYAVSTLTLEIHTPDGQIVTRTTKDITIWRKQADGSWLIEVDISNPNPPAQKA